MDGMFEGLQPWDLDWHEYAWGDELKRFSLEYRIGLVPVTLGEGSPLFKPDSEPLRLQLLQSRPLGDRCLLLRYQPAAVAAAAR
jgi:hypothetical protein